jgi:tetratricopeptide (TPR) repeat protein
MRHRPPLPGLLLLAALLLAGGPGAAQEVSAGDAAWARRAEGHQGPRAAAGPTAPANEAVAAYERAVRAAPNNLEAQWKLLRALHFQGEHVSRTKEERQAVFDRGRNVAEKAIDLLARRVGGRAKLDALSPQQAAKALAGEADAAPVFLYAAVHWGLWGDSFGRLAAARQGVGDKVRRYSEIVIALDERFETAGGHRVLGRLHTLAPKVPLVTGWVDRGKAVAELRRAVALAPDDPYNQLFLAEALLEHQPDKAAEARTILRRLVARPPAPARVVEEEKAIADAKALLARHPG